MITEKMLEDKEVPIVKKSWEDVDKLTKDIMQKVTTIEKSSADLVKAYDEMMLMMPKLHQTMPETDDAAFNSSPLRPAMVSMLLKQHLRQAGLKFIQLGTVPSIADIPQRKFSESMKDVLKFATKYKPK